MLVDSDYFKRRTVQISLNESTRGLPSDDSLRSSLASCGDIWYFQSFSSKGKGGVIKQHTAIVVFYDLAAASRTMSCSHTRQAGSFWQKDSVKAHGLKHGQPYEIFWTEIVQRLWQESQDPSSRSNNPPQSSTGPSNSANYGPSLKRPRTEDSGTTPGGSSNTSNHASTSNPSQTPGHAPAPTERLLARISQLTAELNSTRAARDRTIFERDSIRTAYTAEQRRHRETLYQKEAVEVALSQEKAERARILTKFGSVLVYGPNPTGLDGKQKTIRLCSDECDKSSERIKTLQREMSEAQVRHLGEQDTARKHATKQLDDARVTIQQLKSDLKQSNLILLSTQQRLKFTQKSMESMEQARASTVKDYEETKEELELYKGRLENEQMLVLKLKDTLIPAKYPARANWGMLDPTPSSGSGEPSHLFNNLPRPSDSEGYGPLLKRPRTEDCNTVPHGYTTSSRHTSASNTSQASSAAVGSLEWMRVRIVRLEAELNSARAACNTSNSEQSTLRVAYQDEQQAHQKTNTQKKAAEAAVSRGNVERDRLRAELEATRLYGPTANVDEGKLTIAQSCSTECNKSNEDFKTLEQKLEEAERLRMEEHLKAKASTGELIDAKAAIKQLELDASQSKFNLASVGEQLESKERECALILEEHKDTKEKLEGYKRRLEHEQMLVLKLRDMLISEAYRSLGAAPESLGVIMSAMELPQVPVLGNTGPN
ncbi:unnamed protein product [Rhizoctonia solani]|uniref:Uncharacterized protein n=1 Tax=Rhizoctonia solani TaxID=456999 RepID=A0A8H3C462_9AGAM|nr:unnamed protein product [Rhizoctonia solani]